VTSRTDWHTVRLEYALSASPHGVYRAWLEPDLVRRWLAQGDQEVTRVEIDEHLGGHYWTWKADAGVIVVRASGSATQSPTTPSMETGTARPLRTISGQVSLWRV